THTRTSYIYNIYACADLPYVHIYTCTETLRSVENIYKPSPHINTYFHINKYTHTCKNRFTYIPLESHACLETVFLFLCLSLYLTHTYTHTHTRTHTHTHTHSHTHTPTHTHTHTHSHTHSHPHTHPHTHIHA